MEKRWGTEREAGRAQPASAPPDDEVCGDGVPGPVGEQEEERDARWRWRL